MRSVHRTVVRNGRVPQEKTIAWGLFGCFTGQRERYCKKLSVTGGVDPYEVPRNEWMDDVDLWPAITYIHVGMYLVLTPSPYTKEDLLNYRSLDCYVNFVLGFVRRDGIQFVHSLSLFLPIPPFFSPSLPPGHLYLAT